MRLLAATLAILALAAPAAAAAAGTVRVTVDPARAGAQIAPRFVGLSVEASDLPRIADLAEFGNFVTLLRSLGRGVLRFGGASVDAGTAYSPTGTPRPGAATTIVPADLARLARLARLTGWSVLLAVDLGDNDPAMAAAEAADAARRLGPDLVGVEIGNEPEAFVLRGLRGPAWSYADYRAEIGAYRRAIARAAPGVAIVGPDTVTAGSLDWLARYAHDERPALLTPHFYPLHRCFGRVPTIADLLGRRVARKTARAFAALAAIGRAAGIPVRVGETNNVGCAGQAGVSTTFAAALWAVRYQLAAARAGLVGVTFHTLDSCLGYSPLCAPTPADVAADRLRARPEWYALLLFSRLQGARLVRAALAAHPPWLTVDALRRPKGALDIVAVNSGPRPIRLSIGAAQRLGPARLLALTAPALDADAGVRLASAPVDAAGTWAARHVPLARPDRDGRLRVVVPAASALLAAEGRHGR